MKTAGQRAYEAWARAQEIPLTPWEKLSKRSKSVWEARSESCSGEKLKTKTLKVGKGLDLPLDAVTRRIAWMGSTGSGKTFGCKRMVEQMLHARAQVVILDGMGVWPGLRLGKKPFDIPVFGGLYGDIPLEPTAGALVADVIVDHGTSVVLDVSQMLDAERTRFATAFGQRFFQRKKAAPSAVHLVLEECQEFIPQNYQHGEERMLHEFVRISKQGRTFGMGVSFISQRPQEVSKKALNQSDCVFAFQMSGTQERKALQSWLSDRGIEEKLSELLPHIEVGAPRVWSPQWLKVSKHVRILPIESLDTSATPKVGEKAFALRKLRPIDLKELTTAMAETVERAKLEDPKVLRARVVELEKELSKKTPAAPAKTERGPKLAQHEVVVDGRDLKSVIEVTEELEKECAAFIKHFEHLRRTVNIAAATIRRARQTGPAALAKRLAKAPQTTARSFLQTFQTDEAPKPKTPHPQAAGAPKATPRSATPGSGLRRMLVALAQNPQGLSRRALGARAGVSPRSGTFASYLSRARTAGWVEGRALIAITPTGLHELGAWDPLPTGADLIEYWITEVGKDGGPGRILRALADVYPRGLTRNELAESARLIARSGTFASYLSRLRSRELIDGKEEIRLAAELGAP